MKRQRLLRTLAAAGLAAGVGCGNRGDGTVRAEREKLLTVPVTRVERHNLSHELEVTAEFRPYLEVEVHAKVAGYLKSIAVDVGDRVAAGQVLAVLEVPEYAEELAHAAAGERRTELDVVRAKSEVKRAESAYQMRRISFERLEQVSKARPKLVAQQELDMTAAQLREAEGQLETAKAAQAAMEQQVVVSSATKERVRTMMNYLRITAPFAGVVTKRYAHPGAMIQAGTASQTQAMPVVRISQISRLRMILPIPESAVSRIRPGEAVEVRVDALKQVIQGRVARYSGRLEPSTRTMETEVDIENPTGSVMPGMFGTASLVMETRRDALAVPVQAISGHNTKPTVLVLNATKRIEERAVTLGLETPALVEVSSGVAEGDLVVVGNRGGLKTGMAANAKLMPGGER